MPAYIHDVYEKIRDKLIGGAIGAVDYEDNEDLIKMVAKMTIETIGLAIASNGEIYNPAPAPSTAVQPQRHVRWSGGRRRR